MDPLTIVALAFGIVMVLFAATVSAVAVITAAKRENCAEERAEGRDAALATARAERARERLL